MKRRERLKGLQSLLINNFRKVHLKTSFIIGLCLLLWLICYFNTGSDEKNMRGFRSYPKEVQNLVRRDTVLGQTAPLEINLVKVLLCNFVLFTAIFLVIGLVIKHSVGFDGFVDTFIYFFILGEVLNLFDLVVIDLLWWRNTPRIRFSCAQDKELYQDPSVHIASFSRGVVMYIAVALVVAGLLTML